MSLNFFRRMSKQGEVEVEVVIWTSAGKKRGNICGGETSGIPEEKVRNRDATPLDGTFLESVGFISRRPSEKELKMFGRLFN